MSNYLVFDDDNNAIGVMVSDKPLNEIQAVVDSLDNGVDGGYSPDTVAERTNSSWLTIDGVVKMGLVDEPLRGIKRYAIVGVLERNPYVSKTLRMFNTEEEADNFCKIHKNRIEDVNGTEWVIDYEEVV